MPQSQNSSSFQSESTGSQPDAEVGVAPGARSNLTTEQPSGTSNAQGGPQNRSGGADDNGQETDQRGGGSALRLDQPPNAEYPYTELRPEARSRVTPDDPGPLVGDDATATFDSGPSNPTERASSESLSAATAPPRDAAATGIDEDMRGLQTEDADPDTD